MGFFTKDIKTMDDLFVHTLRDIYYAEKRILKALPEMIDKATDATLKAGFQSHLKETEQHVSRLEEVFRMHGAEAKTVTCPAIDGIIEEAEEISGDISDKEVLDAALAAAAQAVEHYEITRYGTLIAWAKQLGRSRLRRGARPHPGGGEGRRRQAHQGGGSQAQRTRRELIRSHAIRQSTVIPGLVPGIHDRDESAPWMAGTSPAMTAVA